MGHRLQVAKVFVSQLKLNCLMLSYRGYGLSEGSPNEKGIKLDGQTALDFVTNHNELSKTPIVRRIICRVVLERGRERERERLTDLLIHAR